MSEMDEYRVEVCLLLRKLERLDKDKFTEDERADAEEVYHTYTQLQKIKYYITSDNFIVNFMELLSLQMY